MDTSIKTIDAYISQYPKDVQLKLEEIRKLVHDEVPQAQEKISYGLATFTLHGNLVHFGGYDKHIGFYPGAAPIAELKEDLKAYVTSKGTVRFPIDKPLPLALIRKLVKSAAKRNLAKMKK